MLVPKVALITVPRLVFPGKHAPEFSGLAENYKGLRALPFATLRAKIVRAASGQKGQDTAL
jgi:hypothetical protein